jgi:nitrite transporter NirC
MFRDEVTAVSNAAKTKFTLLQTNLTGYFLASMLAGAFVGFGVLLAFTLGGVLAGSPFTKLLMGCSFSVALSLVVMAGGELFTGNNFVMAVGVMKKTVTAVQCLKVWCVCYVGNLVGSVVLAAVFVGCGLATGDVGEFMANSAAAKMAIPPLALICRSILCNILVCLGVWCTFRCKSETAKLIMIFWCLLTFVAAGFEHSVANMTLLTISLMSPASVAVSFGGWIYNIGVATVGNIIGGAVCVAMPYLAIAKGKP